MYMQENFWLIQNMTDVSGQLAWLADVLEQATTLGEKVRSVDAALARWVDGSLCARSRRLLVASTVCAFCPPSGMLSGSRDQNRFGTRIGHSDRSRVAAQRVVPEVRAAVPRLARQVPGN